MNKMGINKKVTDKMKRVSRKKLMEKEEKKAMMIRDSKKQEYKILDIDTNDIEIVEHTETSDEYVFIKSSKMLFKKEDLLNTPELIKIIICIQSKPIDRCIVRHFKGKLYQQISLGIDRYSNLYVVYRALYGEYKYYIRPYKMFFSLVDKQKYPECKQKYRFEYYDIDAEKGTKRAYFIINNSEETGVDRIEINRYLSKLKYINKYSFSYDNRYDRSVIKIDYDPDIYREEKLDSIKHALEHIAHRKYIASFVK